MSTKLASESAEGFICPYCLVSFASANKLQAHFIEFHNNEESDMVEMNQEDSSSQSDMIIEDALGHSLKSVALPKPRSCDVCKEIIWSSSLTCQACQMVIHAENCLEQITKVCQDHANHSQDYNQAKLLRAAAPPPPKGIPDFMRRRVSRGRNRFVEEGFDLDLTYITERIIAMSFPGSGLESVYRNSLMDVAKMLKTKHKDNYMIFNLSERSYDISRFNNQVLDFGWPDHLAPSLERLGIVCKSMKSWLDSDDQHVVVVHCKGGKGRTGCVIAAFMNYSQICHSAKAALDHFAMKRFYDSKLQGVTQPSQRRYVHYFSDLLAGKINLNALPVILRYVIIHGVPNFDNKGGCRPFLKVYQNMELMHTSGLYVCPADKDRIKISLYGGLKLEGEILIKCFHKRTHTGLDSIFQCQFHHAVIRDLRLVFGKEELNDAFRDKRFPDSVKVELIFDSWSKKESPAAGRSLEDSTNIRQSLLAERMRDIPGYTSPSPEDKRNSYDDFEGGYDHGRPGENLIKFEEDERERSESIKMDPALIERIATENGELYTVVSKDSSSQSNSKESSPSHHRHTVMGVPVRNSPPQTPPMAHFRMSAAVNGVDKQRAASPVRLSGTRESELVQSSGSHKYSHLFHQNQRTSKQPPAKPLRPPMDDAFYSEINEVREEVKKLDDGKNHDSSPEPGQRRKYDLINNEGKKLVLTQAPHRSSVDDSEIWMTVKWQTLPQEKVEGTGSVKRSSSQGDLSDFAVSEDYTNLTDIAVGTPFITETQHKDAMAVGDDKIAISQSSVASKIVMNPDAINDEIYTVPPDAHDDEVYSVPPEEDGIDYDEVADPEYINYDGEALGQDHDYQNQQHLALLGEFVPASSEPTRPAVIQQKALKESSGIRGIMQNLGIIKPTKTVIQSTAISEKERKEALPPLQFGTSNKLLVGRGDYMHFTKDSWGGRQQVHPQAKERSPQAAKCPPHLQASSNHHPPPASQPGKLEAKERAQLPLQNWSPNSKRKPHKPPSPEGRELPPLPSQPAHITQQPKPHNKLQAVKSQPMIDRPSGEQHRELKPHRGSGKLPHPMGPSPHGQPKAIAVVGPSASRSRPNPPPKPLPYRPEVIKPSVPPMGSSGAPPPAALSVAQIKAMMTDWYRPNITRDAAITMVKRMESGCFVVRDSQTVSGGYALTIKVSEELVRQRRKLGPSVEVTDDMCVTHFLIQPDPDGVKLQGWNEPAFKTLPDFIAKHTSDRLCLPCVLRLVKGSPESHSNWRKHDNMRQSLMTGAACDLVFLGNLEVAGSTGDAVIGDAAQQLKALDLPTITIINFKASNNGITITDSTSGLLNKRNYPIHSITYCGFDPNDTRWDFPNLYHLGDSISLRNKQCFGIIHKMLDGNGHICLLFAELDEDQPVPNVVSYVRQLLSQHPPPPHHHHHHHPHRRH